MMTTESPIEKRTRTRVTIEEQAQLGRQPNTGISVEELMRVFSVPRQNILNIQLKNHFTCEK